MDIFLQKKNKSQIWFEKRTILVEFDFKKKTR